MSIKYQKFGFIIFKDKIRSILKNFLFDQKCQKFTKFEFKMKLIVRYTY